MQLTDAITFRPDESVQLPFVFKKQEPVNLNVEAKIFDPLVLAYVIT
jgi:hypothetical protein